MPHICTACYQNVEISDTSRLVGTCLCSDAGIPRESLSVFCLAKEDIMWAIVTTAT
jgi:hypothetical protein